MAAISRSPYCSSTDTEPPADIDSDAEPFEGESPYGSYCSVRIRSTGSMALPHLRKSVDAVDAADNKIREIKDLTGLKLAILSNNRLKKLPEFDCVTTLFLNHNELSGPIRFELQHLKLLNVSNNQITALNLKCPQLEELYASTNKIAEFTISHSMERVDLRQNALTHFPDGWHLAHVLLLSENRIKTFPNHNSVQLNNSEDLISPRSDNGSSGLETASEDEFVFTPRSTTEIGFLEDSDQGFQCARVQQIYLHNNPLIQFEIDDFEASRLVNIHFKCALAPKQRSPSPRPPLLIDMITHLPLFGFANHSYNFVI